MKIIIHGTKIELTPAIKSFIEEKVGALQKFSKEADNLIEARVEIGKPSRHHKSGPVYYAEINLKIGGKLIRAESHHADLYTAINLTRDKTEIELIKFKEKKTDSTKRSR